VTFDTGVDQTLGGYVHIKIDCGTSRSQLIPGNAGGGFIKDGDYYEQYNITRTVTKYEGRYFSFNPFNFGWIYYGEYQEEEVIGTAYRINDGGESYYTSMPFTAEIELIFKMYAPATNTFASNSQGTNLWATTLPGGVSD